MSRTLWFVAGAGAGVYAIARARRVADALTPEGLADRLAGLSLGLHLFTAEVRAGMAEKETEVRKRLAVASPGAPEVSTLRQAQDGADSTDRPIQLPTDRSATMRESTH